MAIPFLSDISGKSATLAGTLTLSSDSSTFINLANTTSSTGKTWRFSSASNGKLFITQDGVIDAITIEHTTGNAIFAGAVDVNGNLAVEDEIHLTDGGSTVRGKLLLNSSDRDNVELRAESLGSTMKFFTVGTEALLLDASQNATFAGDVGIGTMPSGGPQAALHVSGPFNTNAPTGNGVLMGLYNSTHGYIQLNGTSGGYIDFSVSGVDHKGRILYDNTSNYMRFDTNGSEKLRINSSGNATFSGKITATGDPGVVVTGSGNSTIHVASTGTGLAGMYMDASNGDFIGSDYVFIGQDNDKTFRLESFNSSGDILLRESNTNTLRLSGGNATFAGDVIIDDGVGRLTLDSTSGVNRILSTTTGFGTYELLELRAEAYEFKIGTTEKFSINGSGNATFAGTVTATHFYGDGSNLTGVTVSNADTVDNLHAASFLRSDAADTATGQLFFDAGFDSHPIMLSGAQNFDNIDRSGFYNLYNTNSGSTNSPGFDFGTMIAIGNDKGTNGFGLQIAHERLGTGMYVRGMNDTLSAWSAWAEIWTSTTDGSGSGLDADFLDGVQGSQFLRSDADDTATGIISVTKKLHDYDTIPPNQNLLDIDSIKISNRNDIYGNATKTVISDYVAKYVNDNTGETTIRIYVDDNILVDGDSYMVSVYYENLIGTLGIDFADTAVTGNGGQTGTSSAPKSGRIYGHATRADYTSTFRFVDINLNQGSGHEVTLHSPKVEAGTTLTDFVATERTDMPTNSMHVRELIATSDATFAGDVTMTQSSGNNILFINSSGGGNPVIYMQDSARKWGQFVASGDLYFKNETTNVNTLLLSGSNATFAGRVSVGGASNPTAGAKLHVADGTGAGLEVIPSTGNDKVTLLSYDRNASAYQSLNFEALDFSFLNGNATFAGNVDVTRSSTGEILSRIWNSNTGGNGTAVMRIANSGNQANGARLEFSDHNYYNATVSVDRTNGMRFMVHDDSTSMSDLLTHTALTIATDKNATFAGRVMSDTHFQSSDTNATLSATGTGNVYLRPNGYSTTTGQVHINTSGNATFAGDVIVPEYIKHSGDLDTSIRFTTNQIRLYTGNNVALTLDSNQNATFAGNVKVKNALIDNASVTSATTTTTVASVSGTTYAAVFFDYVIYKSSNIRAGTVVACSDGTSVSFAETSTTDLGDTSDVTLAVDYSSSNFRLRATTTSSTWNIKAIIRAI